VVLEKPLGHDLASAQQINDDVGQYFQEQQIFRIDHYLGKETVQNLMVLRFGNTIFEPLWRSPYIKSVQITVAESVGVGSRAGFYDGTGAMRDMVQNHLLQLLCIVAMEPPVSLDPDAVRDEKLKVLRSLRPMTVADVARDTVRGQYTAGAADGDAAPATCRRRTSPRTAAPRPSWRSRPTSTTGAGPMCPFSCAPASAWPRASPRS
jgi:glucose-6-phosphate 1-dehydrogenase